MKKLVLIFICFLILDSPLIARDIRDSLVAYWSFEDSTARDFTGHGYDGTFVNNPIPTIGVHGIGTAMSFHGKGYYIVDGTDVTQIGSHIILPYIDFQSLGDFTMTMWVREDSVSNFFGEYFIGWGEATSGWLGITNACVLPDTTQFLIFSVGSNNETTDPLRVSYDYTQRGNWQFYCLVYKNNIIYGYENGKLIGSKAQNIKLGSHKAAMSRHWWNLGEERTSARFYGALDEVMIFKTALTNDEIGTLYNGCANSSFAFPSFISSSTSSLQLNDNAHIINNALRLTNAAQNIKGSAFFKDKVPVAAGFENDFVFKVSNGNDNGESDGSPAGGEGFAFVIHNANGAFQTSGNDNPGYEGIPNSLAIEFDFHKNNSKNDPDGDHIAVMSNGYNPNFAGHNISTCLSVASNTLTFETANGKPVRSYYGKVIYDSDSKELSVFVDTTNDMKIPKLLLTNFDFKKYVEMDCGYANVGFTAACGKSVETHEIFSWYYCPKPFDKYGLNPKIINNGTDSICGGVTSNLNLDKDYRRYLWSTGDTCKSLSINTPGVYSVMVNDSFGCNGYANYTIYEKNISVNLKLDKNSINCSGDSATAYATKGFKDYQWFDSTTGKVIYSGSDEMSINKSGTYYVRVVDSNGCFAVSNPVRVLINYSDRYIEISTEMNSGAVKFDSTFYSEMSYKEITIKNKGSQTLIINDAYIFHNVSFSIPQSQFPIIIPSEDSIKLKVSYKANKLGIDRDTILLNDPCGETLIPLLGIGKVEILNGNSTCNFPIQLTLPSDGTNYKFLNTVPYPVPSGNNITISFSKSCDNQINFNETCKLFNSQGNYIKIANKLICDEKIGTNASQQTGDFIFDTSELVDGIYFVIIETMQEKICYPVIINH